MASSKIQLFESDKSNKIEKKAVNAISDISGNLKKIANIISIAFPKATAISNNVYTSAEKKAMGDSYLEMVKQAQPYVDVLHQIDRINHWTVIKELSANDVNDLDLVRETLECFNKFYNKIKDVHFPPSAKNLNPEIKKVIDKLNKVLGIEVKNEQKQDKNFGKSGP